MKFTILVLFLTFANLFGQDVLGYKSLTNEEHMNNFPEFGMYYQDNENKHQHYVGTWVYSNSEVIFTINFTPILQRLNLKTFDQDFYYFTDGLLMRYKLEDVSGNVIFSNLDDTTDSIRNDFSYSAYFDCITGSFIDKPQEKIYLFAKFEKIDSSLHLNQIYFEYKLSSVTRYKSSDFYLSLANTLPTFPNKITFIKQ
jgi:hypothetical protein